MNTKQSYDVIYQNYDNNRIKSLFQYVTLFQQVNLQVSIQNLQTAFSFCSVIETDSITSAQLEINLLQNNQIDIYGIAPQIATESIKIQHSVLNFQCQNVNKFGYSLSKKILSDIYLLNMQDRSNLISNKPESSISMSGSINGSLYADSCRFYQVFMAQESAALLSLDIQYDYSNKQEFVFQNSFINGTVSSTIVDNYGFIKEFDDRISQSFDNLTGRLSGVYISLARDVDFDDIFKQIIVNYDISDNATQLLDRNLDVNNTRFSIGTTNNISADGQDVSLLGQRELYYGVQIVSSKLYVTANSFTFIQPEIRTSMKIANILFNITVNATTAKVAGLALTLLKQLELQNCTFGGEIVNTGSIYLLFEVTKQPLTISYLKTQCDLQFGQDSYGLIKQVNNSIIINQYDVNMSMSIIGDRLVESSLMFQQINGRSAQINYVSGYYGGYVTNKSCTQKCGSFNDSQVNLEMRTLQNINLKSDENITLGTQKYMIYQPVEYRNKLNGTRVIFSSYSLNRNYQSVDLLCDSKIVLNTHVQSKIYSSSPFKSYFGGISGISQQSQYTITNFSSNITYEQTAGSGNGASCFATLNAPATFNNISILGDFSGKSISGGLIAELNNSQVTMKNISIQGKFQAEKLPCAGVIATITNQSQTSLENVSINILLKTTSPKSGPIYGENNGTIQQLQITSIQFEDGSFYKDCPIGQGIKYQYDNCPEKSSNMYLDVSDFSTCESISSTLYHPMFKFCYGIDKDLDLNNSKVYVTLTGVEGEEGDYYYQTGVSENRSLFNIRPYYTNLKIMLTNEPDFYWDSNSYGFAYLVCLVNNSVQAMNNIYVQATASGASYGSFSTIALYYTSTNCTQISNITVNVSKVYFNYASGLFAKLNISLEINNISVNTSFTNNYHQGMGLIDQVLPGCQQLTVENCILNYTAGGSCSVRYIINSLNSKATGTYKFNNITANVKQPGSPTFVSGFYQVNSSQLIINNSLFNVEINTTGSTGMLNSNYAKTLNVINSNFTGILNITSSTTSSYDIAIFEGSAKVGIKNITNCTIYNQTLVGKRTTAGMFGYVSRVAAQIYIDNCTVNTSLSTFKNPTTFYMGGFIAYYSQYNISSVSLTNSLYNNLNGADAACDSAKSISLFDVVENVKCLPELKTIIIEDGPTSQGATTYNYTNISKSCYWQEFDGSEDLNFTTFDFQLTENQTCNRTLYHALFTLFNPSFVPTSINNVTLQGTLYAYSYSKNHITIMVTNSQTFETVFQNIQLNQKIVQRNESSSEDFNTTGIIYQITGTNRVQFINCISAYTIERTTNQYMSTKSSSQGFYYNNSVSTSVSLTNCTSNMTLVDNEFAQYQQLYSIGYVPGNCSKTKFVTNNEDYQCQ